MKRAYTECNLALQCEVYNADDPCENPSHRFMRKPVCYTPIKEGLISKTAERVFNVIKKSFSSILGSNNNV